MEKQATVNNLFGSKIYQVKIDKYENINKKIMEHKESVFNENEVIIFIMFILVLVSTSHF